MNTTGNIVRNGNLFVPIAAGDIVVEGRYSTTGEAKAALIQHNLKQQEEHNKGLGK